MSDRITGQERQYVWAHLDRTGQAPEGWEPDEAELLQFLEKAQGSESLQRFAREQLPEAYAQFVRLQTGGVETARPAPITAPPVIFSKEALKSWLQIQTPENRHAKVGFYNTQDGGQVKIYGDVWRDSSSNLEIFFIAVLTSSGELAIAVQESIKFGTYSYADWEASIDAGGMVKKEAFDYAFDSLIETGVSQDVSSDSKMAVRSIVGEIEFNILHGRVNITAITHPKFSPLFFRSAPVNPTYVGGEGYFYFEVPGGGLYLER